MHVAVISLEPWDQVWRRNQHFAAHLMRSGAASRITFVEPPRLMRRRVAAREVDEGIVVLQPSVRLPKRLGGLVLAGRALARSVLRHADVLWVNDPTFGVHCLRPGLPAVYDVTDDWREFTFSPRIRRRLVRAEDALAARARTVVCSAVLQDRWLQRYGVHAAVVNNGVDQDAWRDVLPVQLDGPAPHVGYVGTLHEQRLDVSLVLRVAQRVEVGVLHLVGPDALGADARARLAAHPKIRLHGPIPGDQVPGYSKAMDVLISPHVVTPFTLSLDAIKSYEYLTSGRPVVATPTSGFQSLPVRGLAVVDGEAFPQAVVDAISTHPQPLERSFDWRSRTAEFAAELHAARVHAS